MRRQNTMKFQTTSQELLARLQTIARITPAPGEVDAPSGVRLTATPTGPELHSTDAEVGLRLPLAGEVSCEGDAVVTTRVILDLTRHLPEGPVSLELRPDEQDVEILAGTETFHIPVLRDDFARLPQLGDQELVVVPATAFIDTIAVVARSASRDERRPILAHIHVSARDSELRMVATDSFRLSVKETVLDPPIEGGFEGIVPGRALQELEWLASRGGQIGVAMYDDQVLFQLGDVVLSTHVTTDWQFPDYRKLMPEPDHYTHELRLAAEDLIGAVRRIGKLVEDNEPMRLTFSEGQVVVSVRTPEVSGASGALPAPFSGEPFEIGFNADFLRDGLESAGSSDLVLKLIAPGRPGLIESTDESGFRYLIMPVRLSD